MGFKEDNEYSASLVAENKAKKPIVEFSCNGTLNMKRRGKFRLDKVDGFEIFEDAIYIYLPGGQVLSDRNPELESKLNNLHLY